MDEPEQGAQDMEVEHIRSLESDFDDFVSEMLLASVSLSGRKYGRETRAAHMRIVSEVYSPPRVTAELKKDRHTHLVPGFAFDVTVDDPDDGQPWDFFIREKRGKARAEFNGQKP